VSRKIGQIAAPAEIGQSSLLRWERGLFMNQYLGPATKKSFWNAYDHIGGCILLNLLWSLLSLPWLGLAFLMLAVGWTQIAAGRLLLGCMMAAVSVQQLMISPVSAALWAVTARWARYEGAAVKSFFPSFKKFFGRSIGLWFLFTCVALLLAVNAAFYQRLPGKMAVPGTFAAGLMGWAYFFLCLMQIYVLPFLVQGDLSIKKSLRRSAWVVLDNVWYTLFLGMLTAIVLLVGLVSMAGLLFISVGLVGVITNTGLREILKRYQPEEKEKEPRTWAEIRKVQNRTDEESRGWRDLWRPWDG
jgi:uncharacterized membrane protein YesL